MAASVDLLVVPFDSASRSVRMGAGPQALLDAGLVRQLEDESIASSIVSIEPANPFRAEIATTFDLHRQIRSAVEASRGEGRFPITLSGNCNTGVIGSLAAEGHDDVGLFWFDAHSDAETPESSTSGFLDGMGLAIALGTCWKPMLESVGGSPLHASRAAHVGAREVSSAAQALLAREGVILVSPEAARTQPPRQALGYAIEALRSAGVRRVHVHVDLDVLDPDLVGPANEYALPGGVTSPQLNGLLEFILDEFELVSASVASYDPALDVSGSVAAAGLDALTIMAARSG